MVLATVRCHRLEGELIAAASKDDSLGDGYRDRW